GVGRNVKKAAGKTKVFEEWPEILVPRVAVEWKAPEIVEQHRCGNDVENEQQRRLATIDVEQYGGRTEHLEHTAEHQQQRRKRGGQRDPAAGSLRHRRLMIEELVERAEREYQHQTEPGEEGKEFILLGHGRLRETTFGSTLSAGYSSIRRMAW